MVALRRPRSSMAVGRCVAAIANRVEKVSLNTFSDLLSLDSFLTCTLAYAWQEAPELTTGQINGRQAG